MRCVNCPQGSAEIENLLSVYGEQLIAVSIHAGFFSDPYAGQEDFRTEGGTNLLSFLGEPLGFPTAVINRKQFAGEDDLQLGQASWGGYIAQELTGLADFVLDIENDFDSGSSVLDINISVASVEDFTGQANLTVMLTENNITSQQLTPAGDDLDYVHKHVLREVVTSFDGDPIDESLDAGKTIEKSYSVTIPDNWNINNCSIVAFIHDSGNSKVIFQADEAKLLQ